MTEETIAMIFAGFAVLATLVTWAFYIVAGSPCGTCGSS